MLHVQCKWIILTYLFATTLQLLFCYHVHNEIWWQNFCRTTSLCLSRSSYIQDAACGNVQFTHKIFTNIKTCSFNSKLKLTTHRQNLSSSIDPCQMTEVRISGNTNKVAVDCLELLNVVTESNDLRRAHKRAGSHTQHPSPTKHTVTQVNVMQRRICLKQHEVLKPQGPVTNKC